MKDAIRDQIEQALRDTGLELRASPGEVAAFAAERAFLLSMAAEQNEPGLAEAVEAAADRVWLFAAGRAVRVADAADARAWGLLRGLLLGLAGAYELRAHLQKAIDTLGNDEVRRIYALM